MSDKSTRRSLIVKDTKAAADLLISIASLAIALIFYFESLDLPKKALGIGPGDYPRVVCVLLLFLAVFQSIKILIAKRAIPVIDWEAVNRPELLRLAIAAAATLLFYLLLKRIDFLLLAPAYLFFIIMFFGYRTWWKALVISAALTTALYFLFTKVFQVMLPSGLLG